MKKHLAFLVICACVIALGLPTQANAITTVFMTDNQAGFEGLMASPPNLPFYLESFDALSTLVPSPNQFGAGAFAYSASDGTETVPTTSTLLALQMAGSGLGDLSFTWDFNRTLTLTFNGTSPVNAIGGNFFVTDGNLVLAPTDTVFVNLNLADGSAASFGVTAASMNAFTGFIAWDPATDQAVGITSVTFATISGNFGTLNNLEVGTATPEPATFSMLGGALLGLGLFAKRLIKR
ncbi:MAG: hypothetical protein LAP87_05800 [Acidobacteriia bacterium]|nr:hypothetical protein [Terriglobia bacterium]